jgi:hypothetical protein
VGSSSFGIGTRVERRGHDRLTAGLRLTGAECPTLPAPPVRRVARERAGGKSGPGLRVSMSQQSAGTLRGRGDSPRCQCSDIGGNCGSGFHGGAPPQLGSAEEESLCLAQAPGDQADTQVLSVALAERARSQPAFDVALAQWSQRIAPLTAEWDAVHNTVSGGTFHGPVVQTRDLSSLTFNSPSSVDEHPLAPTPPPAT